MPTDATKSDANKRRSSLAAKIASVSLLVLFALFVSALTTLSFIGRSALNKQVEAIRAHGEPVEIEQLWEHLPVIPDHENSALVILALADRLVPLEGAYAQRASVPYIGDAAVPAWNEPWPGEMVTAIAACVTERQDLLAGVDVIHDLPRGRFVLHLDPQEPLFDQLFPVRGDEPGAAVRLAAKLEALAAAHNVLSGNVPQALTRVETIGNIGASLADDALLISALIVLAVDDLAVSTMEFALSAATIDPAQSAHLSALLSAWENRQAPALGLRGERLIARKLIAEARAGRLRRTNGNSQGPGAMHNAFAWLAGGWFDRNEAKILEMFAPLIDAGGDVEKALPVARKLDADLRQLSRFYLLASMTLPALDRAVELWARHDARLRCARTALAAERYRQDTGNWPAELAVLAPDYLAAVPTDPFDGAPLRYRRSNGGIAVYSIGEDGRDDGADLSVPDKGRKRAPDVGFRLLDVDSRGVKVTAPL